MNLKWEACPSDVVNMYEQSIKEKIGRNSTDKRTNYASVDLEGDNVDVQIQSLQSELERLQKSKEVRFYLR